MAQRRLTFLLLSFAMTSCLEPPPASQTNNTQEDMRPSDTSRDTSDSTPDLPVDMPQDSPKDVQKLDMSHDTSDTDSTPDIQEQDLPSCTDSKTYCPDAQQCVDLDSDLENCGKCGEHAVICDNGSPRKVAYVHTKYKHTCAILDNDDVYCWGLNNSRQLAPAPNDVHESPFKLSFPSLSQTPSSIHTGENFSCLVTQNAEKRNIHCWGNNEKAQLGSGSPSQTPIPTPQTVSLANKPYTIAIGDEYLCYINKNNTKISCWGDDKHEQLGHDGLGQGPTEVGSITSEQPFINLFAGKNTTCARTQSGKTFCWGENKNKALPKKDLDNPIPLPQHIPNLDRFDSLAFGSSHACGLDDNEVYCWGKPEKQRLGMTFSDDDAQPPTQVPGLQNVQQIVAGHDHTCVLYNESGDNPRKGLVMCWGENNTGQLGIGLATDSSGPINVSGDDLPEFTFLTAGRDHTCALSIHGTLYCWGDTSEGQTGTKKSGMKTFETSPVQVAWPQ